MSNRRPFLLSSFLPDGAEARGDEEDERHSHLLARNTAAIEGTRSSSSSSSDDDDNVGEVFYNHEAEQTREREPPRHPQQNHSNNCDGVPTTSTRRTAIKASAAPASMVDAPPKQPKPTATVRQYGGLVNTAVATMDRAVRVPSALRGAARRTMFDVLVDVKRRNNAVKRDDMPSTTSIVAPPPPPPPQQQQASSSSAQHDNGRVSARERAHWMLFPSAATGHTRSAPLRQRGSGDSEGDPMVLHGDGSGSSSVSTIATVGLTRHSLTAGSTAQKAESSPDVPSTPSAEGMKEKSATKVGAAVTASSTSGPDRRLRHLIPAHLGGANEEASARDSQSSHRARPSSPRAARRDDDADVEDSISDISTSSTERSEFGHVSRAVQRSAAAHRVAATDACLLDFLEGGKGARAGLVKPAKDDPLTAQLRCNGKRDATASAGEAGWLQRLDGGRTARGAERNSGGNAATAIKTATDSSLLEGVLMGIPPHYHRHPAQTCSRSPSHRSNASNTDTTSTRSASDSDSSSRSRSRDSLDLMRDVDGGVPRWVVCQQAARQSANATTAPQRSLLHLAHAAGAGRSSGSLERAYAAAMRLFIGKPAVFYPSCAAARRQPRDAATGAHPAFFGSGDGGTSRFQRTATTGTSASTAAAAITGGGGFLASAAAKTTAVFFAGWKEGRRLLKQNPMAVAVVEYLSNCFERWRPYDATLSGDGDGVASSRAGGDDVSEGVHGTMTPALQAERRESGVEVRLCVHYVEAAFNVAVVHGSLVWCSDEARTRLEMPKQQTLPMEEVDWTFLFPEAALMQLPIAVGEHVYLAHPYHVYHAERLVVASYNFTTDGVVRQQRRQYDQETRERERVAAPQHVHRDGVAAAAAAEEEGVMAAARAAQDGRHRGVSPTRTSAHAFLSQTDRSPTDLRQQLSSVVGRSTPSRSVYEIPGSGRTPQRTPVARAQQTTTMATTTTPLDPPRSTSQGYGVSPEPHPPSQPAHSAGQAARALYVRDEHGEDSGGLAAKEERHGDSADMASLVRASVHTVNTVSPSRSVNSFAVDGFYDPLAMPAFATTNFLPVAAVADVGRFISRDEDGVTMVLTGDSTAAECVTSEVMSAVPSHLQGKVGEGEEWTGEEVGSTRMRVFTAPPPLHGMPTPLSAQASTTHPSAAAAAVDTSDAWMNDSTPVRTFGSAEAVVPDAMGDGFPRGPPAEWDVPVEVLYALSGVKGQRASGLALSPGADQHRQGIDAQTKHADGRERLVPFASQEAPSQQQQRRKRPRHSGTADRCQDEETLRAEWVMSTDSLTPPPSATPTQETYHNVDMARTSDVSYSFPTPAPSHTELPSLPKEDVSSCSSVSSPSNCSDSDLADAPAFGLPRAVAAVRGAARSRGRRLGGGGGGTALQPSLRQAAQQQQQDEWMRRLWQSQSPAGGLHAAAAAPTRTSMTTADAPTRTVGSVQDPWDVLGSAQAASASGTDPPCASASVRGRQGSTARVEDLTTSRSASVRTSANVGSASMLAAGAMRPPPFVEEKEEDTTSNTMTGLYDLNDVILSDSDD